MNGAPRISTVDERTDAVADEDEPEVNLAAPETRAAGRWMSAGVPTERSQNFGQSVRRLLGLLRPEWARLIVVIGSAVTAAILNVLGPRVLGEATDTIIDGLFSPTGMDIGRPAPHPRPGRRPLRRPPPCWGCSPVG